MDCSRVSMARRTPKIPGITKRAATLVQKDKRQPAERPQCQLPQANRQVKSPGSRKRPVNNPPQLSKVSPNQLPLNLRLRKRAGKRWARVIRRPEVQVLPDRVDQSRRRCCLRTSLTIFRCNIRVVFINY